jgi:hypothetical protein
VVERRSAVDWSERRFWRTDAVSVIPDIFKPFWCETRVSRPPSFLIGRPGEVGSKLLRKSESLPPYLSPEPLFDVEACGSVFAGPAAPH